MRLMAWPVLALLLAGGLLYAQEGLNVDAVAVVEGKATPGGEYTLKLRFTVPEGYHAYHKDNRDKGGFGLEPLVQWTELSGLTLLREEWPDAKEYFEPELGVTELVYYGTFEINYVFRVPDHASGTLTVAGSHETQFCDAHGCLPGSGEFGAVIEVEGSVEPSMPTTTVTAAFASPAAPGGEARLNLSFTLPDGWHAYHKDTGKHGGYGVPPSVTFHELSGLTQTSVHWPEAKLVRYDVDWAELEYKDAFTLTFVFDVPADAAGKLTVAGRFELQICDDICIENSGTFTAALTIAEPEVKLDPARVDSHGFYLDFDYAFEQAKALGKPLLVDFNGVNCPPCRRMERTVFTLPEVKKLFEDYVIVSLLTDVRDARANELFAKYRPADVFGPPYYAVLNHEGERVRGIGSTLPASERAHEFVAFLKGEDVVRGALPPAGPDRPSEAPAEKPADWPQGLPAPLSRVIDQPSGQTVFDFEARFSADRVQPGGEVSLELRINLQSGDSGPYNLYHPDSPHANGENSLLLLEMVSAEGLEPLGDWQFPQPYVLPVEDERNMFEADEWKFYGDFVITRNFRVPTDAEAGSTFAVTGTLAGQWCNLATCVWFADMAGTPFGWRATLTAAADGTARALTEPSMDTGGAEQITAPTPAITPTTGPTGGGSLQQQLQDQGFILLMLLIFGLGILTLFTPCVLPVLPLTISFFVKQAEQGRSSLVAALIYCSCIIFTFTFFGFLTSVLLGPQGAQIVSTNGFINIGIGVLFMVLALSFFGAFELEAPGFIRSWISRKQMGAQQKGKGYVTALLSGGSFSIISFSCTGPIAAAILAGAAGAGSGDAGISGQWLPFMAMLAFSAGLALPIFFLGQFPGLMKKLPKSGGWMNALKVTFAFIEVAIAIRYFAWADIYFSDGIYPAIFTREVVDAVWIACAIGAGLYLLGLFRMSHDHEPVERLGTTRTLIAISALTFAAWMLPGLIQGKPMGLIDGFLPPREQVNYGGGEGGAVKLEFTEDLDAALERSRATGVPVFVDFTGEICANCRWVETNIFPRPVVSERLRDNFILVHQWTDRRGEGGREARENYAKYAEGGGGVPMYVVVDGNGNMVDKYVPPQFINSLTPELFAEFLDRALQNYKAAR